MVFVRSQSLIEHSLKGTRALRYFMREEFEKMAAAGKFERHHIESLVQLTDSGYCMHRSWGFGRIKTVDTVFARFTIDFHQQARPHHGLGVRGGIAQAHFQGPHSRPQSLRSRRTAPDGRDATISNLSNWSSTATAAKPRWIKFSKCWCPDVIRDDWKKWWEAAKRELKKDGHFQVPLKKTEPIIYQVKEVSLQDRLIERIPRRQRSEGAHRRRQRSF